MDGLILRCCEMLKVPPERMFSVRYQVRLLLSNSTVCHAAHADSGAAAALLECAAFLPESLPFARGWTEKEAAWQCARYGAVVSRHADRWGRGMLTGYLMQIADPQQTKCLLLEDVLWGTLEFEQRESLLRALLAQAAAAGARLAILPCSGYVDMAPFKTARFRTSSRVVHAYLSIFSGAPAPGAVSSMYLDVL